MVIGRTCCFLFVIVACRGEKWKFPDADAAASVRIDTKVKFIDGQGGQRIQTSQSSIQLDEVPFKEPTDTKGFYNRPPGGGKYPVRVQSYRTPYQAEQNRPNSFEVEGTLDAIQFCKCVSDAQCDPRPNSEEACGAGKYLCCYQKPNRRNQHNSEFFNEIEEDRPNLYPGQQNLARPFPPPPGSQLNGLFGPQHNHQTGNFGALNRPQNPTGPGVLTGPNGPTGVIGPGQRKPVLVGPDGPTGLIGPAQNEAVLSGPKGQNPAVLVGPEGPTGLIGPVRNQRYFGAHSSEELTHSETAQRGVLVGPGGPTGIIGPGYGRRPMLIGPGGSTGIIGPGRRQGVLVGPGGPTGIIGPGYGRQYNPGVLVGPGGPTGVIGPGRQLLVGPGGPTGQIGPYGR